MKENLFISDLNKKDTKHFTSEFGLFIRRKNDKLVKYIDNILSNNNIIRTDNPNMSDEDYYNSLNYDYIDDSNYDIKDNKNNIILERSPLLNKNESYIFVANHTCPEDIETILSVLDRNTYLVLGSIETLKYNKEMYLLFINGMIPFDILDNNERHELMSKMEKVINKNSILIFPEGSHNLSPNKIVNDLFDGPVNLAKKTNKKIVLVTLLRDNDKNMSYIDFSNPIDINSLNVNTDDYFKINDNSEKYHVKSISEYLRDKMATSMYALMSRHSKVIHRSMNDHLEDNIRKSLVDHAFDGLEWSHDVFDAEYLTKKNSDDEEYKSVIHDMSNLRLDKNTLKDTGISIRDYIIKDGDLENKDIPSLMRKEYKKRVRK